MAVRAITDWKAKGVTMSLGKMIAVLIVMTLAWSAGSPSAERAKELETTSQQARQAYDQFRCEKDGLTLSSDGKACESLIGSRHPIP